MNALNHPTFELKHFLILPTLNAPYEVYHLLIWGYVIVLYQIEYYSLAGSVQIDLTFQVNQSTHMTDDASTSNIVLTRQAERQVGTLQ